MASSVGLIARVAIGVILLAGSVSKVLAFRWFVKTLASYKLVPQGLAGISALAVILSELVVGALTITGKLQPWTAFTAVGLFVSFTLALIVNLIRGRTDINCGCLGLWKKDRVGWQLVFRNLGLASLALLTLVHGDEGHFALALGMLTLAVLLSMAPVLFRVVGLTYK